MKPETMVLLSLCVAGVAHLLVHERGAFGWLASLRQYAGVQIVKIDHDTGFGGTYSTSDCVGSNELARMLCCTVCCSFWLSLLAVIIWHVTGGQTMGSVFSGFISWFVIFQLSRIWQRFALTA